MHRLAAAISVAIATVALVAAGTVAAADTGGSAATDRSGIHSGARAEATRAGASGSAQSCTYIVLPIQEPRQVFDDATGQPIETDGTGSWYEKWCDGVFVGAVYIPQRDPAQLLEEARRYLYLPLPTPNLSPSDDQVVNLRTWMWLTGGWSTESSAVSVPGVSVSVVAKAVRATWTMGDGNTVVCTGPGTAFDPTRPGEDQTPTCSHIYQRSSASQPGQSFPITVTVRWHATWQVTGAPGGGDLGFIDRTTSLSARVGEVQAVNTNSPMG